jgi:magnesium transporter
MDARGNLVNNSTNNLLRKLTLINVVFLPLNLVAGIGGMSEYSMMTAPLPWWWSYTALIVAMLGMGAAMVWGLRRMARAS